MRQPSEIIINGKTLADILEAHKKWLNNEGGERADLSSADLSRANLSSADLSSADLRYANLSSADLSDADLSRANLSSANLSRADLSRANLSCADLSYANLSGTDLRYADLSRADLSYANLDKKEQCRKGVFLTVPIKGYKKTNEDVILEAEIPAGAIVFSINNSKCRTNRAKIVSTEGKVLHSKHDNHFTYTEGQEIEIKDFDLMYNVECASGFHFFKTRKEAEEY